MYNRGKFVIMVYFFPLVTLFHTFYLSKEILELSYMSEKLSFLSCTDVIFVDLTQPGCDNFFLHSTDYYWATPKTS